MTATKLADVPFSYDRVFGIFSEMQNGYSFEGAVGVSERALGRSPDHYRALFSQVRGDLCSSGVIQSSPWNSGQKSGMGDIRRRFNSGVLGSREAREELKGLGLPSGTASQVVLRWEDHMPGFQGEGFDGLGQEPVVLRPHQTRDRRESMEARKAAEASRLEEERMQGNLFSSRSISEKRKKSKYNGALVNNTFADATEANPAVMASADHPSIRYLVLCHLVAPERRGVVNSSLSGTLDTFLYWIYSGALGEEPGPNIKDVGDNGRVSLKFDTDSGVSSEVDLGGNLETGYVVESISDPLGVFPEGTVDGDFLESGVVGEIVRSQGERDSFVGVGRHEGRESVSSAAVSVSKKQASRLAGELRAALDSGEVEAPPVEDEGQAWQLVRLAVRAIQGGRHTIRSADAEKWAGVLYEPRELRMVFQFVENRLQGLG